MLEKLVHTPTKLNHIWTCTNLYCLTSFYIILTFKSISVAVWSHMSNMSNLFILLFLQMFGYLRLPLSNTRWTMPWSSTFKATTQWWIRGRVFRGNDVCTGATETAFLHTHTLTCKKCFPWDYHINSSLKLNSVRMDGIFPHTCANIILDGWWCTLLMCRVEPDL